MSDDEPIPIPTNGHRPPLGESSAPSPGRGSVGPTSASASAPVWPDRASARPPAVTSGTDPRLVLTPAQLATGFGVLAGLLVLVLRARRRGKRG